MSDIARPEANLQDIRRQIDDAKRQYDALDMAAMRERSLFAVK